jgi:hypothetical protein
LNYGWIGHAPVTYSVNIAQGASYVGGQVHIMIMPGTGITELAPDWNEADALVLFISRQANGSVVGSLRYKLNNAGNNSYLFGSDTNVFGPNPGQPTTNTIVAGYGGLLGSVTNAAGYVGTWSIQMTSATGITLTSPGGSHSFAFPQLSDAQAFTGPVTVYWGVQPNSANRFQDSVLSGVSITGSSPNTLNVDLTQALNPNLIAKSASTPALLFATPANAVYWLQWAPAIPNYVLQSASSLTGPWSNVVGPLVITTNFVNTFGTSNFLSNTRNYNPPPMAISYDFGADPAATVDWVSGPTYDAGGSSGSGSVELKWTWAGSGNEAFTMDLFPSGQNLAGGTLSFDIMIDPSSTAGTNSDYGYLNVVARDGGYGWNPTSLAEGLLTAAGGTVGTWAHVSIPLGSGADSTVRALTFQISNDGNISGSQTIYIDNLQLTTSNGSAPILYNVNAKNSTFITSPMLPSSGSGFFRLIKP